MWQSKQSQPNAKLCPSEPFTCLCCHWLAARQKIQVKVLAPTAKSERNKRFQHKAGSNCQPLPPTQVPLGKRLFANCGLWALLRKHFIFTRGKSKTYHPLCSASGQQATLSQRYTSASKLSCPMVLFGAPCPVQNRNSGAFLCLSGCWSSKSVD